MESKRNLHRYDIIEAEIIMKEISGSIQKKKRPYVIVGNELGTSVLQKMVEIKEDMGIFMIEYII